MEGWRIGGVFQSSCLPYFQASRLFQISEPFEPWILLNHLI
jgi:hypothetical protein